MASGLPLRRFAAVLARRKPSVYNVPRRLQSSSATQTQNPAYPLYPSVSQLIHEKGIPESEVSKIPASGPKGRLLKGDVLAYLGAIAADLPSTLAARFKKLSHLDLSNIKIAPPPEPVAPQPAVAAEVVAAPPRTVSVAVSVSLAAVLSVQNKIKESLGITVPLTEFLARATDLANDALPRSASSKPTADELFDEILGASPVKYSRGDYVPELNAVDAFEPAVSARKPAEDLIDFLSGKVSKKVSSPSVEWQAPGSAMNIFSLTVPEHDEKRAKAFLERVKVLLQAEPGRLVL